MASTNAARALSSAARQVSRSASTIFNREVSGSHKLTIDGYSVSRKIPQTWWETSQTFEVAGHSWSIRYVPRKEGDDDCISLYLELVHGGQPPCTDLAPVQFKFSLLDKAGNPIPGYSRRSKELCAFRLHPPSGPLGFDDFVKSKDLHESGALKDDRFSIRCDITAIRDWTESDSDGDGDGDDGEGSAPVSSAVGVPPPSDLHQQLSDLLWKHKHGTDVAIDVAGETFDAHGWLLAARSPVLEAELQALASSKKEKESSSTSMAAAARRVMKVKGMEPKVFKAMLHFLYTDALPQQDDQDGDAVEMARGLLAAAHRYKLERLKLMCEDALRRRIDVDTVAGILVAAEEHRCQALKAACLEFLARPGCMKAVMETRGFEEMKATCLPLLLELLIVKQLS